MTRMVLSARALTVEKALTARALTVKRALTGEALAERTHTAGDLTIERALTTGDLTAERALTAGDLTTERALTAGDLTAGDLTAERALSAGILTRRPADLTAAKRVHLKKAVMLQCTRDGVGAGLLFARETQQVRGAGRSIVEALLTWIKGTGVGRGKRAAGQPTAVLRVE